MISSERARLARILGMLGSEYPGEQAAAASQAEAFRKRHGLTWEAMLSLPAVTERPEPPPRDASKEAAEAKARAEAETQRAAKARADAEAKVREADEARRRQWQAEIRAKAEAERHQWKERARHAAEEAARPADYAEAWYANVRAKEAARKAADDLAAAQAKWAREDAARKATWQGAERAQPEAEPPPRFDPPLPWVPPRPPRPLPFERIWRPKMERAMSPRGLFFAIIGVWIISIFGVIAEKF
jgi:hypothetical protein